LSDPTSHSCITTVISHRTLLALVLRLKADFVGCCRASLVCRSWREPAQRILQASVTCVSAADLQQYHDAFIIPNEGRCTLPARALRLISWPALDPADPIVLLRTAQFFVSLRELHFSSVKGINDRSLCGLLTSLPTLKHLLLQNAPFGWHGQQSWDVSSSLQLGLPQLPNLTHVYLEGLTCNLLADVAVADKRQFQFLQMAIVDCSFDTPYLSNLLAAASDR
jgi:hypothetical protein